MPVHPLAEEHTCNLPLFIGDATRFASVYIIKRKSEVLDQFKDCKAEMEKQTGKAITGCVLIVLESIRLENSSSSSTMGTWMRTLAALLKGRRGVHPLGCLRGRLVKRRYILGIITPTYDNLGLQTVGSVQCSPWSGPDGGPDRTDHGGPVQRVSWTGSVQSLRLKSQLTSLPLPIFFHPPTPQPPCLHLLPAFATPSTHHPRLILLILSHVYNTYSLPGNGVLDYRRQDTQGNLIRKK